MNRILETMKIDYFLHLAQTNGTNFTNNNDNVNAIKADFLQKYPDINFDVYYAQSQNDTQTVDKNGTITNYNNAEGNLYAMLTDKSEGNLYLRIIEFYPFFLRQFKDIQDLKKEMDKYRTYPPQFTYTVTTKLKTPFNTFGEEIESLDYFESGINATLEEFNDVEIKSLKNGNYLILKNADYKKAFKKALQLWNKL